MTDPNQSILFVIILVISISALFITRKLMKSSFPYVFVGILGLIFGLLVGALLAIPVSRLPGDYGKWLPMIVNIFAAVAVLDLFMAQGKRFNLVYQSWINGKNPLNFNNVNLLPELLLDTSALIDGRILEVAETGFMISPFAVPVFVIDELQQLADSKDDIKREKGRRGLELLEALRQSPKIDLRIIDKDIDQKIGVDHKLVVLAKERGSRVLTTDSALNRSATIQGVVVLNLNDLAASLKPVVYPGETMNIEIVQKGKERGQGVGYLADGTMVVVEGADKEISKTVNCNVVRVFQTSSGRMLFAEITKTPVVRSS
ncbi:MAG: TRAM domain-containing protein [Patescibacteria group bacterium]|jgi:uncharacterized protein YacL